MDLPTLWYENENGDRWVGAPGEHNAPSEFIYQVSRFPNDVSTSILRFVLRKEVDECEHKPEHIKRTHGWIDGFKGRECMACNGTQVCKESEDWPLTWDAEWSRQVMRSSTSYSGQLVCAMMRPSWREIARQIYRYGSPAKRFSSYNQAVLHAAIACEACANVMAYRHGLAWGYPKNSAEYIRADTRCELCEHTNTK